MRTIRSTKREELKGIGELDRGKLLFGSRDMKRAAAFSAMALASCAPPPPDPRGVDHDG